MKLSSQRDLNGLKPTLIDPSIVDETISQKVVYWVFSELTEKSWANLTVISPDRIGEEFPKTFGHYHGTDVNETYHLISGEGILLMQKKDVENRISDVVFIKAKPGDEIVITPEWGHSWSNVGDTPLLSFDDWRSGHTERDYKLIEELGGMSYYLTLKDGEITYQKNPRYDDLPEPIWMTPDEFKQKYS